MASAHSIARAGRHATPCASSLTRVLPPPLSRVPRQETRSGQQRAHTHTQARAQVLSACRWGHMPAVVWQAQAAMLPRASSLTRVLPPPLSRVPRRGLYLYGNELTALPATVFNGLTNLE
jgi:hypothetical protein